MPRAARPHSPRKPRQRGARPSAHQRGYGARWRELRATVLAERPLCETPGCREMATDVDHRVRREAGGSDDASNLVALCHRCHSRKTVACDGGLGRTRR